MSHSRSETDLRSKVAHAGAACMESAKDLADSVLNQAQNAAASVREKTNAATAAVGSGMESLADNMRQNLPRDGTIGGAASSAAQSLEGGGRYRQQKGLGGIAQELTDLVRRNPIATLLVGVGLGFLLARVTGRGSGHDK